MVIIITILTILLILFIILNIALFLMIKECFNMIVKPNLYPCKRLYIITRFNAEEEGVITDFSRYETEKVIFQIINMARSPQTEEEMLIDGKAIILSPAVVYQVKDEYLWKY